MKGAGSGAGAGDFAIEKVSAQKSVGSRFVIKGVVEAEARDENGFLKWRERVENIIVNVGLDYITGVAWAGTTPIYSTWYIGLTDGTPSIVAGDTMASHGGWVEVTAYDEGVRQTWSKAKTGTGQYDNSASKATFTIDTNSTTIGGIFLASDNTKGGTSGTLHSGVAFSSDRVLDDNDTLTITYTLSIADDGV